MEEQEWVLSQLVDRNSDDIPGSREPGMGMSYAPLGLEALCSQPLVGKGEALAAVVVLSIVDPYRAPVPEDGAVLRHPVWNAGEDLRQVERRVGVMADAKQEYLPVHIVHSAGGTLGNVGWKREWVGGDPGSVWSGRREGLGVIAAQYSGHSPERIRHDAQIVRCGSGE
jgi:hypothetical protein